MITPLTLSIRVGNGVRMWPDHGETLGIELAFARGGLG